MPEPATIGIVAGLLVTLLLALIGYVHRREGKLRKYYRVRWKKSSALLPTGVLGPRGDPERGFNEYYLPRDEDNLIRRRLEQGRNTLIVGRPLAGKSRAAYEALVALVKPAAVTIPRVGDVDPEDFLVPRHLAWWRKPFLVLDDLDKYVERQHFIYLLHSFLRQKVTIVATCRSGAEYNAVCAAMEAELSCIFDTPVRLRRISLRQGRQVATGTRRELPRTFDRNVGSIFLDLSAMRQRFLARTEQEKMVMRSLARLYYSGLYREREIFSSDRTRRVCEQLDGLQLKAHEWTDALSALENQEFLRVTGKELWAEEAYLEFPFGGQRPDVDGLREVAEVFADDPEALFGVANRAAARAPSTTSQAAYAALAVEKYRLVLQAWSMGSSPRRHAMTQNNLGTAYLTLAEVEDKADNCRKAITAYEEALRVYTFEDSRQAYGMTQANLGNAYARLAEDEERRQNCRRAIEAYEEALRVHTLEDFPMDYGKTRNNLGNAYATLAQVEERAENCRRAIEAYEEALRVYTLEEFATYYAMAQNGLGTAYWTLAEVEEKGENCRRAIKAFEKALGVYTLEDFRMDYGMVQSNLGAAYTRLAGVEDKPDNCRRAIEAYEEALRVYRLEGFRKDYAMTQNGLGTAYMRLAEAEDKADNCRRAIDAYEEALGVIAFEEFPIGRATMQRKLGTAYWTLAEVEEKGENCRRAIEAYEEALGVYSLEDFPMDYGKTQNDLGTAYATLAEVADKLGNCKRGIAAFEEALRVRTLEDFPVQYGTTQNNLGEVYSTLAGVEEKRENCQKAVRAYREALAVYTEEEFPQVHSLVAGNLQKALEGVCRDEDVSP